MARKWFGSVARAEDLLTACVRECGRYVAGQAVDQRLAAAIGALVVEYTALQPDTDAAYRALLGVGRAALETDEVRLARRMADSAVALRPGDKEAWLLRARSLELAGRAEAELAWQRYRLLADADEQDLPPARAA
ncbi:hypothetical protein [Streptomyces aidingensis]|uniref:Tetratricopeptide repeat-containing protein n=1 Tax=Streptomyces aidingensis TaxID=910347 RepID=A0A1I1TWQ4_9ACTN|nr:hypothetical protein [Streptomyces aidingensis]SFD62934.1 hypothetical protein SAMN05421773_12172 [Streptomyces aidingensis]